jgi:signal transduction histidine kinase/CheY-like chemotaxis protein
MRDRNRTGGYLRFAAIFLVSSLIIIAVEYISTYADDGDSVGLFISAGICVALILVGIPVMKYINKVWANVADADYFHAVHLMSICSMAAFVLLRMPLYFSEDHYARAVVVLLFILAPLLVMVVLIACLRKLSALAFLIPSAVFIFYTSGTLSIGGQPYYFLIYLVICAIGAVYSNYKMLFRFTVLSHAAIGILIAFGMPLLGGSTAVDAVDAVLIEWVISIFVCAFFLMLSRFSAEKSDRSERGMSYFEALMATTPNLVALVDDLNRVLYVSRPLARMVWLENHELATGRPLVDFFKEIDMKLMISAMLTTTGYYEHIGQYESDGETHYIKIVSDDLKGSTSGKLIDISDITPIIEAKLEAERSAESRSTFLATTSHEIRTPMNAILGMAEMLLRDELPQSAREKTLAIRQASSNLLSIINDILDFSKIESGKLELSPSEYEFASLMNDVINIIRTRVLEKSVMFIANIDGALPRNLTGDEARVRQVLLNLLSNAVKFTDEGYISLTVSGERINENEILLRFTVADTGIGIKEEDIGKLFGTFTQLNIHRNRNIEGTGLGLAISQSLCSIMGGGIEVVSKYGEGSVFTAVIPQIVENAAPFALVEEPETKSVLLYETRAAVSDSIITSARNLGVHCELVTEWHMLVQELEKGGYPFIFVASRLFAGTRGMVSELAPDSTLVLLAEYGEIVTDTNIRVVAMPAHSISIANVLNGVSDSDAYAYMEPKSEHKRFIAPEARLLIVDDIATNLKVAEGLLSPYETRIDCCKSGAEALELVKQYEYDIIFMDHMMPEMDGVEATVALRAMDGEYFRTVPVVALTANAVSGMREMFLENGFSDYLAKPIEVSKLDAIMARWIPPGKRENAVVLSEVNLSGDSMRIEGVDVARGLMLTGGSPEQYREILSIFCRDTDSRLPILAKIPNEEELPLFVTQIHAMKSASANVGADGISREARRLEDAGRNGDMAFIRQRLPEFHKSLTQLTENIRAALAAAKERRSGEDRRASRDRRQGSRRSGSDRRKIKALMQLKDALETEDIRGVDEMLNSLVQSNTRDDMEAVLEQLLDCVLISDFSEAVKLADTLLQMEKGEIGGDRIP